MRGYVLIYTRIQIDIRGLRKRKRFPKEEVCMLTYRDGRLLMDGKPVTLLLPDGERIRLSAKLSERQKKILMAGGLLRYTGQSLG